MQGPSPRAATGLHSISHPAALWAAFSLIIASYYATIAWLVILIRGLISSGPALLHERCGCAHAWWSALLSVAFGGVGFGLILYGLMLVQTGEEIPLRFRALTDSTRYKTLSATAVASSALWAGAAASCLQACYAKPLGICLWVYCSLVSCCAVACLVRQQLSSRPML